MGERKFGRCLVFILHQNVQRNFLRRKKGDIQDLPFLPSFSHLLLLTGCKSNPLQISTWLSEQELDEDVPGISSRNVAGGGFGWLCMDKGVLGLEGVCRG